MITLREHLIEAGAIRPDAPRRARPRVGPVLRLDPAASASAARDLARKRPDREPDLLGTFDGLPMRWRDHR